MDKVGVQHHLPVLCFLVNFTAYSDPASHCCVFVRPAAFIFTTKWMILDFPDLRMSVPQKVAGHLGAVLSPVYLTRTASPVVLMLDGIHMCGITNDLRLWGHV